MLSIFKRLIKSIALLPSVIALCFIGLAILLNVLRIDYSQFTVFDYLSVSDKSDGQYIFSFIIGGIFTLTIFSYTMVMNVLNRNINNYSPRLIPLILSERHHQLILGFTSGTIIYAMVMSLSLTNDVSAYFPQIAPGLGVIFSIICILLFIYFIHSVSQSIHVNYIIDEVYKKSKKNLMDFYELSDSLRFRESKTHTNAITHKNKCGYLHDYNLVQIYRDIEKMKVDLHIHKFKGDFVYESEIFLSTSRKLDADEIEKILDHFVIDHTVCTDVFETGPKHLVEVAIKASSPAINDPGTSLNAIHFLLQLFIHRFEKPDFNTYGNNETLISFEMIPKEKLYKLCYDEMYRYMKDDPMLSRLLSDFNKRLLDHFPEMSSLLNEKVQ
jgi:uncharacterized membrane protein